MRVEDIAAHINTRSFDGENVIAHFAVGAEYRRQIDVTPVPGFTHVAFADAEVPGIETVLLDPPDDLHPAIFCKFVWIAFPLLYARARASLTLGADVRIQQRALIPSAFKTAEKVGILAAVHPLQNWSLEPWGVGQMEAAIRRGLNVFVPLFMTGAVLRHHDERAIRFSERWLEEFTRYPYRDQPAFLMAILESGVVPLACPPSFLTYDSGNLRSMLWHQPQTPQIARFFYREFADAEDCEARDEFLASFEER